MAKKRKVAKGCCHKKRKKVAKVAKNACHKTSTDTPVFFNLVAKVAKLVRGYFFMCLPFMANI